MSGWAELPGFKALQLSRNFGKEAALTAGLQAAAGDVVVMMDADLQHPPGMIPRMFEHWRQGADAVYAVRANRDDEGLLKRVGARLFYRLLNNSRRFQVPENGGDFRLMDRVVVDALLALPERNRFMKGLYAWIGFDAVAVPYVPDARAHGRSHFKLRRLIHLSLDGLTAFTTWPLRVATIVGCVMALGWALLRQLPDAELPDLRERGFRLDHHRREPAVFSGRPDDLFGSHGRICRAHFRRGEGAAAVHRQARAGSRPGPASVVTRPPGVPSPITPSCWCSPSPG